MGTCAVGEDDSNSIADEERETGGETPADEAEM